MVCSVDYGGSALWHCELECLQLATNQSRCCSARVAVPRYWLSPAAMAACSMLESLYLLLHWPGAAPTNSWPCHHALHPGQGSLWLAPVPQGWPVVRHRLPAGTTYTYHLRVLCKTPCEITGEARIQNFNVCDRKRWLLFGLCFVLLTRCVRWNCVSARHIAQSDHWTSQRHSTAGPCCRSRSASRGTVSSSLLA